MGRSLKKAPDGKEWACLEDKCGFKTKSTLEALMHSFRAHKSDEFTCDLKPETEKA